MFKKLSLSTALLAGLLLAGCSSNQAASSNAPKDKTEQTQKSTKSADSNKKSTRSATANDNEKANDSENDEESADAAKNTNASSTNSTTTNNNNDKTSNKSTASNSGQTSTQGSNSASNANATISSASEATQFLGNKLASTYDRTTTQYVANGKITWQNTDGYQINVYTKGSDSPAGSYLVTPNGQFFQIW